MGCNAWNHPPDCNCGWGGDTGGGGWSSSTLGIRHIPAPDGRDWQPARRPSFETYVNPNARCPCCGANVYFYQSPFGGRVFFDPPLGPPWPKHPCTDNYFARGRSEPILPSLVSSGVSPKRSRNPTIWQPLIAAEIRRIGTNDRIRLSGDLPAIPRRYLYVPAGTTTDRPAFWRRAIDPAMIEISTLADTQNGAIFPRALTIPGWFTTDEEAAVYVPGDEPGPEALNGVGYSLSFAWRTDDSSWTAHPAVNLSLARKYFEAAAERGFWAALNNLAVMARGGLGMVANHYEAFNYFQRAAQSLELVPLRHFAKCLREGTGTEPDEEQAQYIDELICVMEAEEVVRKERLRRSLPTNMTSLDLRSLFSHR